MVEARVIIDPSTRRSVSKAFRTGTDAARMLDAETWISKTLAELAEGTAPETATQRRARRAATRVAVPAAKAWTLGSWADHTLSTNTKRSENTREQYAAAITRHFASLTTFPLSSLTPELVHQGAGPVSVRRSLAALSGVLTDATKRRLIPFNPARNANVPDRESANTRPAPLPDRD